MVKTTQDTSVNQEKASNTKRNGKSRKNQPKIDALHIEATDLSKWQLQEIRAVLLQLRLKTTVTKEELIERLKPLQQNIELLRNRLTQVNRSYVFHTSMETSALPPTSSAWSADCSLYPKVNAETIKTYTSYKKQGIKGQCRKAQRMVLSRKIKNYQVC